MKPDKDLIIESIYTVIKDLIDLRSKYKEDYENLFKQCYVSSENTKEKIKAKIGSIDITINHLFFVLGNISTEQQTKGE